MTLEIHLTGLGYEYVSSQTDGDRRWCYIHQLLAIADGADPEAVFSDGENHVHHRNGIPWANWPGNLELHRSSDHCYHHLHGEALP